MRRCKVKKKWKKCVVSMFVVPYVHEFVGEKLANHALCAKVSQRTRAVGNANFASPNLRQPAACVTLPYTLQLFFAGNLFFQKHCKCLERPN